MLKIRFKNKKYSAVWLVEPKVTIGRAADNQIVVSAPNVAEHHLEILVDREALTLVNLVAESDVKINGNPATENQPLASNDVLSLAGIDLEVIDPKDDLGARSEPRQTNPRAPKATGWALKANHSALQNRVYPLQLKNIVGRSSECDISLAAAHLSRRHAELSVIEGVLYVKDLGSANGTFLNGKKITEARVKRGDDLRFDTLSFGVIGPADDMSKTTVRSAPSPGARSAQDKKPAAVAKAAPQPRAKIKIEPEAPAKPRYGTQGLIVLAVLAAIVVAALYLTRQ